MTTPEMSLLDVLESAFCEAAMSGDPLLVAKRDGFQFIYEYLRDPFLTPEEVQQGLLASTIALDHAMAVLLLFLKDGTEEIFLRAFSKRVLAIAGGINLVLPMVQVLGVEKAIELIREKGAAVREKKTP